MRTSAREKYGSGPSLSTRQDRIGKVMCIAAVVLMLSILIAGQLWT